MNKMYVAVFAVLLGGTALIFNFISGDEVRPPRPGVVLESANRSAPPAAVAERGAGTYSPATPSVAGL